MRKHTHTHKQQIWVQKNFNWYSIKVKVNVWNMKCVNFPLCRNIHISLSVFSLRLSCYRTAAVVLRLQRLTFPFLWCFQPTVFWRAKASLCVYQEDYNLLCSWKQKKDLAAPIICSLFLTIKAWRNKYPKTAGWWYTVPFPVSSRCPLPTNRPHSASVPTAPTQKTVYCHNAAGENIPPLMGHLFF